MGSYENSDTETKKCEIIFMEEQSDHETDEEGLSRRGTSSMKTRQPVLDMSKIRRGSKTRPKLQADELQRSSNTRNSRTEYDFKPNEELRNSGQPSRNDLKRSSVADRAKKQTEEKSFFEDQTSRSTIAKVPKTYKNLGT
jgi:hypothetical protein